MFMCLVMLSCEKEKEVISIEKKFPDTVELITTELKGVVEDNLQKGIGEATITVNYLDQKISTNKSTVTGTFDFTKLAVHNSKSIVVFEKEGFSPNIYTHQFTNGEKIEVKATLKPLKVNQSYNGQPQELQLSPGVKLNINANLTASMNGQMVKAQFIDFNQDPRSMMLTNQSEDGAIIPQKIIWLDIQNSNGTSEKWNTSATTEISIDKKNGNMQETLYYFDFTKAQWVRDAKLALTDENFVAKISHPGFYAILSGCSNDTEKPVPYCFTNATVLATYDQPNIVLYGQDFDAGSIDNCDTDLNFKIRRQNDVCNNGADLYKDSIVLCVTDVGKSLELEVKAIDDNNNSDYCIVLIKVEGQPCFNDNEKPVPYCYSTKEVFFNVSPIFLAESMNVASYDNCSPAHSLKYKIKKSVDICQNGSDQLANSITLCNSEIGKELEVTIEVMDENGNRDFVTSKITVK